MNYPGKNLMQIFRSVKTNRCTQKFGQNLNPIYAKLGLFGHNGTDWAAFTGEEVRFNVSQRGQVIKLVNSATQGIGVEIVTKDSDGQWYMHIYWHLRNYVVQNGDWLDTGDLIGYADTTGQATGSHLHYGLYKMRQTSDGYQILNSTNGYGGAVDCQPWLNNTYVLDYISYLQDERTILQKLVDLYRKLLGIK